MEYPTEKTAKTVLFECVIVGIIVSLLITMLILLAGA